MKLLRKGARKFKLPYEALKKSFKSASVEEKTKFLEEARKITYI